MTWNFKEWYEQHADELNAKRRERYNSDPDYRERVLAGNQAERQKRIQEKLAARPPAKDATAPSRGDGVKKRYTIGMLARAVGRSVQTIRLWEKAGTIPTTPHRGANGARLYDSSFILAIQQKLQEDGRTGSPTRLRSLPKTYTIVCHDGSAQTLPLYTMASLAKTVGRATVTAEQLHKNGFVPETPLRSSARHRLFSHDMMQAVKDVLESYSDIRRKSAEINKLITQKWTDLAILPSSRIQETKK